MSILVTNDDGIYSPGIMALANAAKEFGEVQVVAPDVEQSSMGQAITSTRPLYYKKSTIEFKDVEAVRVNGTPSDCVALGMHLQPKTEVVLSGINMGPNLGNAMWHSGTLAAAKQAVLFGVKGIALSTPAGNIEPDFELLQPWVKKVLDLLLAQPGLALYNVNFPPEPVGIQWVRQSVRLYDGKIVPGVDPMGRKHYWFTVVPLEAAEEGTDRWAMEHNLISITPLRLDLTHNAMLTEMLKQPQP